MPGSSSSSMYYTHAANSPSLALFPAELEEERGERSKKANIEQRLKYP
jgi:hypothetical protein